MSGCVRVSMQRLRIFNLQKKWLYQPLTRWWPICWKLRVFSVYVCAGRSGGSGRVRSEVSDRYDANWPAADYWIFNQQITVSKCRLWRAKVTVVRHNVPVCLRMLPSNQSLKLSLLVSKNYISPTHIPQSLSDCCHRINVIVIITWNVRGYFRCREQQSALRHAALRSSEIRCMCADGLKGNQLCENWLSPSSLGAVRLQMSLEKNGWSVPSSVDSLRFYL